MSRRALIGHGVAIFAVVLWGNTFIATRVLLESLTAFEIMFFRFIMAYAALWIIHPRFKKPTDIKEELLFLVTGLFGVTFYQITENTALQYSTASNVGLLVSVSPIITAVGIRYLNVPGKKEQFSYMFIVGCLVAMTGIFLVMFNGHFVVEINPFGDILALLAAFLWGIYSILLKMVIDKGYSVFYYTRKMFFYAILAMLPMMIFMPITTTTDTLLQPVVLLNLLYLGLGVSGLGFIAWSIVVEYLGAIKSSPYNYLIPLVTIISASIILGERITVFIIGGTVLILVGVYISNLMPNRLKSERRYK